MLFPPSLRRFRSAVPIAVLAVLAVLALLLVATPPGMSPRKDLVREVAREARPYDQPAEAWEFYRLKRAPAGGKAVPAERYLAALERLRAMPRHSTAAPGDKAALGTWTPLGPGNVGGRTRSLVIDPRRPRTMYAGGVAGGVWKTTNGGRSWRALDDFLPSLAINALALDPAAPDTLYAGTGEGTFPQDAVRGAGIFKTTDGGASWRQLPGTATPDFYYVNDIIVSPLDPRRLYAATWFGVRRSLDAGESWQTVLDILGTRGCHDLALQPHPARDMLLASCSSLTETAVYRNAQADGAGDWQQVLSEKGMGRTSLAVAPSNPAVVYALASSTAAGPENEPGEQYIHGLHAVFRSNRGGAAGTWRAQVRNTQGDKLSRMLLTNPLGAHFVECGLDDANIFVSQGWYDNVIAVDPKDPNRVWAGGVDLFRSDDGGRRWGLASYWWADQGLRAPSFAHADQHGIVFHPGYDGVRNRILFVTNDGGVYRTTNARAAVARGRQAPCDPAASRVVWTALNQGYGVTQFYHGAPLPDGRYFGGTQDNGTQLGSDEAGPDGWREILGGDGGYVAVDPRDARILYASGTRGRVYKSTDGGASFKWMNRNVDGLFLFISPSILDPNAPRRLWLGGSNLWRSDDAALTWKPASAGLNGLTSALAVAPRNSSQVLAGTSAGYIYRSAQGLTTDGRTLWGLTRPRIGFVTSLAFDPHQANVAYATYSNFGGTHVWKTADGGATWTALDGTGDGALPDLPVHAIVPDPTRPGRLYLGTDLGVFVSEDGGAHWAVENTGFANVVTESLTVQEGEDGKVRLYAFTHGRGAWRVEIR